MNANAHLDERRADHELTHAALLAMLEDAPDGIAILDGPELRVQFANHRFLELFEGLPNDQRRRRASRLEDFIPMAEHLGLKRQLAQVSRTGRAARESEVRVEGLWPHPVYWNVSMATLPAQRRGSPLLVLRILDVTEQVQVRDERDRLLLLAEQRAEQFGVGIEHVTDGVVVVDLEGRVRRINSAAIEMLDLDPQPAQESGQPTAARRQLDLPPLHLSLRGQTLRNVEYSVERRDGETTWLNVCSAPLYDRDGQVRGAVAGFQDISKRKELEQLKDDFLAVTAHELRTPVTALLGYSNLMVRRAEQAGWHDRDLHALRMIATQAQRLTELVNGLVDVSRVQTGTLELSYQTLDLHAVVRQAAAAMRAEVVEHTILVEGPQEPVMVRADAKRLNQVISHLIGNALKYSPWGGSVQVRVWKDGEAHVSVTDGGIGIPEEALPRLFQRFYRANNVDSDRISGLGIGLYILKELVDAHHGRIDVRSVPNQGTTFEVTLPLT